MLRELLLQSSARLNVERAIDRLVGDVHAGILRILSLKKSRDLLWRPIELELRRDNGAELRLTAQTAGLRALGTTPRSPLSEDCSVVCASAITRHFTDPRGRRAPELTSDLPKGVPSGQ